MPGVVMRNHGLWWFWKAFWDWEHLEWQNLLKWCPQHLSCDKKKYLSPRIIVPGVIAHSLGVMVLEGFLGLGDDSPHPMIPILWTMYLSWVVRSQLPEIWNLGHTFQGRKCRNVVHASTSVIKKFKVCTISLHFYLEMSILCMCGWNWV